MDISIKTERPGRNSQILTKDDHARERPVVRMSKLERRQGRPRSIQSAHLENELGAILDYSPWIKPIEPAEGRKIAQISIGHSTLRVVPEIEEFHSNLHSQSLCQRGVLEQR